MHISIGNTLPEATFLYMGDAGPEQITLSDLTKGRTIIIFAVPGAYTPTCHSAHVPGFTNTYQDFVQKGVGDIICVSVNDPFVMKSWGQATGATDAGIKMLSDSQGQFTKAIGMDFTAEAVGLMARSKRYAMIVDDGVVRTLNVETSPGECEISAAQPLLDAL